MRLCLLLLLAAIFLRAAGELSLSPEERQSEAAWLASLGLQAPDGGPLLESPFTPPWTARSFLTPTSWWKAPQPREVAADALRQDLSLLRVIMEKAYGGWVSAQKRGWALERLVRGLWTRQLAEKGTAKVALPDALAPFRQAGIGPVGQSFRVLSDSPSSPAVRAARCWMLRPKACTHADAYGRWRGICRGPERSGTVSQEIADSGRRERSGTGRLLRGVSGEARNCECRAVRPEVDCRPAHLERIPSGR